MADEDDLWAGSPLLTRSGRLGDLLDYYAPYVAWS